MYEWRGAGAPTGPAASTAFIKALPACSGETIHHATRPAPRDPPGALPFDIRILMQKDGSGESKQNVVLARVAARGRLTSNLSRGGTSFLPQFGTQSPFGRARDACVQRSMKRRRRSSTR